MLKIKDNIDLKVLEKYDFRYAETCNNTNYWIFYFDNEFCLTINEKDKLLRIGYIPLEHSMEYEETTMIDLILDLIQDGLVEKVTKNE